MAAEYLRYERGDHTLQPTALVHEAYVSLARQHNVKWENRAHFLAIAATTMRRILVDHARRHKAEKRGRGLPKLTLSGLADPAGAVDVDLLDLNDALERFAELDAEGARVVELRFFAGLNVSEVSDIMDLSPATVKRRWALARAWLFKELVGVDGAATGTVEESR